MKRRRCALWMFPAVLIVLLCSCRADTGHSALKILLSNDDGIEAPGLAALFEKLSPLGQVTVAASVKNYSGVSHSIATEVPIRVEEVAAKGKNWYAIDALPATCVRFALENLLAEKPDIVIIGINRGDNTGVVTFYSATVAGAREAAFTGLPALAVHLERGDTADYDTAASFIAQLVKEVGRKGLKPGIFLNVNIPALPKDKIKGVKITKQDLRSSIEIYEKRTDAEGEIYYWPGYKRLTPENEKTDIWALRNGYISITPFQFDQTAHSELKILESWTITKWKE